VSSEGQPQSCGRGLGRDAMVPPTLNSVCLRRLCCSWANGSALTAGHFWQTPGWPAPPKVTKRSCPLHPGLAALDLIRCAHPSGQPAAVTPLRSVSSFHHCSRGTPRRAIPGPSRLSRHPCRSTPYATIPLGLLMGRLASSV
jgi:hypothetical protein